MRKNYKPQSKQNKLTNTYRKKTIDPGVDLDIKKDKDNLDNIDDYWDMAEYVMEDGNSESTQKNAIPKEATKLMKKNKKLLVENVESSVIEDAMEILTDGIKDSSVNSTLFDIDGIRDNVSSNKIKSSITQNNTSGFDMNYDAVEMVTENSTNNSMSIVNKKNMPKNTINNKEEKITGKRIENNKEEINKKVNLQFNQNINKKTNVQTNENVNKTIVKKFEKKLSLESKILEDKTENIFKGEIYKDSKGEIYGLSKISTLYQGKSKLEPLITKRSLESGILFLQRGSSIINEKADVSFTILVLKGTIKFKLNDNEFILKRESCFYINEGSIYNIINESDTEIKLFITFKAK